MTADNDQVRGNSLAVWLTAWLTLAGVVLPMAYVLSIGPAIWLVEREYISVPAFVRFERAYAPVFFVMDCCPPFQHAMCWYNAQWRRHTAVGVVY